MVKGLDEKTKSLITNLRTIGNSDEMIASVLNISLELVEGYRSLALVKAEDDIDEMIRLYREGFSTVTIGEKLGWSYGTVQKLLKKAIPDEYRTFERIDDETDKKIREMLDVGYTSKEIKEALNVSYQAIRARNKNVKKVKKSTKDEKRKIAYLLFVDKESVDKVAAKTERHVATIYRIKKEILDAGGYDKWLMTSK